MQEKVLFKIVVAGDGGVGKTTLLKRFVDGTFDINTKMSIGVEIHQKIVEFDNLRADLILWDLGGQDHFRFLLDSFVDGASGAILMFDITRLITLYNLEEWIDIVRTHDPNLPITLIAGKIDLLSGPFFDEEKTLEFQEKYNIPDYIKVSSKSGENVHEAFDFLVKDILKYKNIKLL